MDLANILPDTNQKVNKHFKDIKKNVPMLIELFKNSNDITTLVLRSHIHPKVGKSCLCGGVLHTGSERGAKYFASGQKSNPVGKCPTVSLLIDKLSEIEKGKHIMNLTKEALESNQWQAVA
jgi:hypothetical protein